MKACTDATRSGGSAAPRQRRGGWDDVSLRVKIGLLVASAAVWGSVVGLLVSRLEYPVWPLMLGVLLVVWIGLVTGRLGVCRPLEQLVDQARRMSRPTDPLPARHLPVGRRDEIGQLARALQRVGESAHRTGREARRLRRTLDQRVEKATRLATRQLSEMAMRDAMTDLANRRFLDTHLDEIVRSCRASTTDLVCIVIDVDDFKQVNDTLGHRAGDELIVFVGELIRALVRDGDYAVRLGGDEFVVLLPGASVRRAAMLCDQLRDLFASHVRTLMRDQHNLGLSMGIASLLGDHIRSGAELIETADGRLYQAKHNGKGRAVGA